jgi:hypothetical protein
MELRETDTWPSFLIGNEGLPRSARKPKIAANSQEEKPMGRKRSSSGKDNNPSARKSEFPAGGFFSAPRRL